MNKLKGCFAALAAFFLMVGAAATFSAQDVQQKPIKVEVSVTTKLIQVAVTDRKGNPIMDLTPADFEVKDAGKVVKIDYLEKHFYGGTGEGPAVTAPEAKPLPRKFFLVFDFAFMQPNSLRKTKEAALNFIDTVLAPGDEVGLVSCSAARSLTIQEYLTTDHKKVRNIVENFGLAKLTGRAENLMDFYMVQKNMDMAEAASRDKSGLLPDDPWYEFLVKTRLSNIPLDQKSVYGNQIVVFTDSMRHLALTLRQIPGNKNIVLFSPGIPRLLLFGRKASNLVVQEASGDSDSFGQYLSQNDSNSPDSIARDAYSEMLKEFEAANCPVYSFNTATMASEGSMDVASDNSVSMKEMNGDDSLKQFAATTGGKYYHNTMKPQDAASDMKNVTGAYYILGYSVSNVSDGEYHKIKVKVNRKGTNVQAQPGYYNPKPFKQMSDFEKLLQIMDVALADNPQASITETFSVTPVPVRGEGMNLFSAFAALPAESLGQYLSKKTEAVIYMTDAQGNNVALKRFSLGDLPEGREGALLQLALPLKQAGAYNFRLILRNTDTGRMALGTARFEIPQATGPSMDPLLLLEEGRNLYGFSPTPELSLSAFYNFDSQRYLPRVGEVPLGTKKILAAARCSNAGAQADVKFTAWVQPAGGETRTDLAVAIVDQVMMGATRVAKLELAVGDLPAGTYTIYVAAALPGGTTTAPATASLVIR